MAASGVSPDFEVWWPVPGRPDVGAITSEEGGAVFGFSSRRFRELVGEMPRVSPIKRGRRTFYPSRAVVDGFLERRIRQLGGFDEDEDVDAAALVSGQSTPQIERLRKIQADTAEIKLRKLRGELADVDVVRRGIGMLTDAVRDLGERVQRMETLSGAEAFGLVQEVVDVGERSLSELDTAAEQGGEA